MARDEELAVSEPSVGEDPSGSTKTLSAAVEEEDRLIPLTPDEWREAILQTVENHD
jgi:hypothetical protein